ALLPSQVLAAGRREELPMAVRRLDEVRDGWRRHRAAGRGRGVIGHFDGGGAVVRFWTEGRDGALREDPLDDGDLADIDADVLVAASRCGLLVLHERRL